MSHEFQVTPKPLKGSHMNLEGALPKIRAPVSRRRIHTISSSHINVCIPIINYLSEYTWISISIYIYIYIWKDHLLEFLKLLPPHSFRVLPMFHSVSKLHFWSLEFKVYDESFSRKPQCIYISKMRSVRLQRFSPGFKFVGSIPWFFWVHYCLEDHPRMK